MDQILVFQQQKFEVFSLVTCNIVYLVHVFISCMPKFLLHMFTGQLPDLICA